MKPYRLFAVVLIWMSCISTFGQTSPFSHTDSLLKANNVDAYIKALHKVKKNALQNSDSLVALRAHFLVLQTYQNRLPNKDSIFYYYSTGVQLANQYDNPYYLANYKFLWANHLVVKGDDVKALQLFQSLEEHVAVNNYDFLPHFYDGYARLLYNLKEYAQAFIYLKKEAKIFENRNQPKNLSSVYNNLGILYKSQKYKDSSLFYHKKSLQISKHLNDTLSIIKSYNNIGQTYDALNDFENAISYYENGYNMSPELATESIINNYAKVLFLKNKYNKAEILLLKVYNNSFNKRNKKGVLEKLVSLYKLKNNFEKALFYQEQLGVISQDILDETKIKALERLKVSFETEKKERSILQLKQTTALQKDRIQKNRLLVIVILIALILIIIIFILYIKNKAIEVKANKVVLEQRLLRSQMNPHFMFNALSIIQTDILKKNNDKAVKYLVKFSKLLRHNLQHSRLSTIELSQEITSIKDYLELQKMRLNQKLNYRIHIDNRVEVDLLKVPSMLLQPIIENAIEHGVEEISNPEITIKISQKNTFLLCVISDNGIGYSNTVNIKKNKTESFATSIIKERLAILSRKYKQKFVYSITDSVENEIIVGTKAILHLPIIN